MQKILKYIALLSVALAGFLLLCYMGFIYYISSETLRKNLSKRLSLATGYGVQLNQAPAISFFPELKASLHNVVLQNKDQVILRAPKIEVSVDFWQALKGSINVSKLTIIKPRIFLYNPLDDFFSLIQHSLSPNYSLRSIILRDGSLNYAKQIIENLNGRILLKTSDKNAYIELNALLNKQALDMASEVVYGDRAKILQFNKLALHYRSLGLHGAMQIFKKPHTKISGSLALDNLDVEAGLSHLLEYLRNYNSHSLDMDLRFSAAKAGGGEFSVNNLASTVQLDKHGLNLTISNGQTKNGIITASCVITKLPGELFSSKLQILLKDADYDKLAPLLPMPLSGKANVVMSFDQKLPGAQLQDLLKLLMGGKIDLPLTVRLEKGQIELHNLLHILTDAEKALAAAPASVYEADIDEAQKNPVSFTNLKITCDHNLELGEIMLDHKLYKFTLGAKHNYLYSNLEKIAYILLKRAKLHIVAVPLAKASLLGKYIKQ